MSERKSFVYGGHWIRLGSSGAGWWHYSIGGTGHMDYARSLEDVIAKAMRHVDAINSPARRELRAAWNARFNPDGKGFRRPHPKS